MSRIGIALHGHNWSEFQNDKWELNAGQHKRLRVAIETLFFGPPTRLDRKRFLMKMTHDAWIYTDAATGGDTSETKGSGLGVVIIRDSGSVHTAFARVEKRTIARLELMALKWGCTLAMQSGVLSPRFHIDSRVVHDQIMRGYTSDWEANADLQYILKRYGKHCVKWIPSQENLADRPSREALQV